MYSTESKACAFVFFCPSDISLTFHLAFWKIWGWFFYWNVCVCMRVKTWLKVWVVLHLTASWPDFSRSLFSLRRKEPLHEHWMLDGEEKRCGPAFPVSLLQTRSKLNNLKEEISKFLSYLGQSSITSIVLLDAAGSALERDLSEPLDDVRRMHNVFFTIESWFIWSLSI